MKIERTLPISVLCVSVSLLALSQAVLAAQPWDVNAPIADVSQEIYQPLPRPDTVLWCWSYYIGSGGARDETYVEETAAGGDDFHLNPRRRTSLDNGQYTSDHDAARWVDRVRPNLFDPDRPPAASKVMVHAVGMDGRTMNVDMIAVESSEK